MSIRVEHFGGGNHSVSRYLQLLDEIAQLERARRQLVDLERQIRREAERRGLATATR